MKKIAVIGAGASGLTAVKCCLDAGLAPTCFERTSDIGGLWNFTEEIREDQACVMRNTVINTSKEMTCFSDFPFPKEFPNIMHNRQVWAYFRMYANKFALEKHIQFGQEVVSVRQTDDFPETGRWLLEILDKGSGQTRAETYDGVMVCIGHHAEKRMPHFEGEENFKGQIIHSHDYKDPRGYEDKRVVVVGVGNSGADVAVDLAKATGQVYLSTRRGAWVVPRLHTNGLPADLLLTNRVNLLVGSIFGRSLMNTLVESLLNSRMDHDLYGMRPEHRFDSQAPTVSDELPSYIMAGSIIVKPNVQRISESTVEFDDGSTAQDVDVIIKATGYNIGFPFVKHPALEVRNNRPNLFKYVFPPDIQPPTLAVIGCVQPIGSTITVAEMHSRLAAGVFQGQVTLPSASGMWADVRKKQAVMAQRYVESDRYTIQVDWIPHSDEVAELIGCKPNLSGLLFSDPMLALECFFGPCTPYQYRLHGPGRWDGARDAILTQWDRVKYPLQTRKASRQAGPDMFARVTEICIGLCVAYILYV